MAFIKRDINVQKFITPTHVIGQQVVIDNVFGDFERYINCIVFGFNGANIQIQSINYKPSVFKGTDDYNKVLDKTIAYVEDKFKEGYQESNIIMFPNEFIRAIGFWFTSEVIKGVRIITTNNRSIIFGSTSGSFYEYSSELIVPVLTRLGFAHDNDKLISVKIAYFIENNDLVNTISRCVTTDFKQSTECVNGKVKYIREVVKPGLVCDDLEIEKSCFEPPPETQPQPVDNLLGKTGPKVEIIEETSTNVPIILFVLFIILVLIGVTVWLVTTENDSKFKYKNIE
jgi:hypothetical protein